MLGVSVTFGPKSLEKHPQQGNFFELTTPTRYKVKIYLSIQIATQVRLHYSCENTAAKSVLNEIIYSDEISALIIYWHSTNNTNVYGINSGR